jgi:4-phospho-D-threonate 3-dehydrogenase / 4-phospho-D-erythronate 3-dehydrogenase
MNRPVRLGLTMGDPAGIGPEILLLACKQLAPLVRQRELELIAIGTQSVLEGAAADLGLDARTVASANQGVWPDVALVEAASCRSEFAIGEVSAEAGRLAYAAVEASVRLALTGAIDAVVTAPFSKEAINLAGYPYSGHTELLAHLTNSPGTVMMLAHGNLRVSHVSTHVAIAKVPSLVTPERVRRVVDLTCKALATLGIDAPRIAVAALNPHAGEGGLFGAEDENVLVPLIAAYRRQGLDISGPHPGDTVFVKAAAGQFDAVVAMYHDQGHIPVKLLGFRVDQTTGLWKELGGVNVTLGLPIIRTSVDHGTAFDIARKGTANPQSMVEAIDCAYRLAVGRPGKPQSAETATGEKR